MGLEQIRVPACGVTVKDGRVPEPIAAALAGRRIRRIRTGESGARVFRCEGGEAPAVFLKTVPLDIARSSGALHDEVVRLQWMWDHDLPVPEVRHYAVSGGIEYLLLSEVPGIDASVPRSTRAVPGVVAALAEGLRLLHATPIADCPFRHGAAQRVEEARESVLAGLVDETDFDEERRGRTAQQLLDELDATLPGVEDPIDAVEDTVFTHGDYSLPNIILNDDGTRVALSGFIDCARAGVGDRYQDLALGARSIASNVGPEWVSLLFQCYGLTKIDERKLRFYTLLDEFF